MCGEGYNATEQLFYLNFVGFAGQVFGGWGWAKRGY